MFCNVFAILQTVHTLRKILLLIPCSYLSDILKICMKIFPGEKKIILTVLQRFEPNQFSYTLHIEQWHIVPTL